MLCAGYSHKGKGVNTDKDLIHSTPIGIFKKETICEAA